MTTYGYEHMFISILYIYSGINANMIDGSRRSRSLGLKWVRNKCMYMCLYMSMYI
jgi:hypothetical protein